MKFNDVAEEEKLFARRALVAFVVVRAGFAVFIVTLWQVQIEQHQYCQTRPDQNDIKTFSIALMRGIICGRNGIPLMRNVTRYGLEVMPVTADPTSNQTT